MQRVERRVAAARGGHTPGRRRGERLLVRLDHPREIHSLGDEPVDGIRLDPKHDVILIAHAVIKNKLTFSETGFLIASNTSPLNAARRLSPRASS